MNPIATDFGRRLKIAGILISVGLLIQTSTLFSSHPTAFLAFILVGGAAVAVGIVIYLVSIVT